MYAWCCYILEYKLSHARTKIKMRRSLIIKLKVCINHAQFYDDLKIKCLTWGTDP